MFNLIYGQNCDAIHDFSVLLRTRSNQADINRFGSYSRNEISLPHTHTCTTVTKLPCLISSIIPSVISSTPAVISPVQKKIIGQKIWRTYRNTNNQNLIIHINKKYPEFFSQRIKYGDYQTLDTRDKALDLY